MTIKSRNGKYSTLLWICTLLLIFSTQRESIVSSLTHNQTILAFARAMFSGEFQLQSQILKMEEAAQKNCRIYWQLLDVQSMAIQEAGGQKYVSELLNCMPQSSGLLKIFAPMNFELATKAVQTYPQLPDAWFWLADLEKTSDQEHAVSSYLHGLQFAPENGLAWCDLGRAYEQVEQFDESAHAYLQCCLNRDPGSNGCHGAGRMMEKLGNIPKAIEYYRLSRWLPARNRADELEKTH